MIEKCLIFLASLCLASCFSSGNSNHDAGGPDASGEEDPGLSDELSVDEDPPDNTGEGFDGELQHDPADVFLPDVLDASADLEEIDYGHGIGAPCTSPEDCFEVEGEAVCLTDGVYDGGPHRGGYCTIQCIDATGCDIDDLCLASHIDEFYYCYLGCKSNEDCIRDEYSCSGGSSGGRCIGGYVGP